MSVLMILCTVKSFKRNTLSPPFKPTPSLAERGDWAEVGQSGTIWAATGMKFRKPSLTLRIQESVLTFNKDVESAQFQYPYVIETDRCSLRCSRI